jgi:hypothetical protein
MISIVGKALCTQQSQKEMDLGNMLRQTFLLPAKKMIRNEKQPNKNFGC